MSGKKNCGSGICGAGLLFSGGLCFCNVTIGGANFVLNKNCLKCRKFREDMEIVKKGRYAAVNAMTICGDE